MKTPQIRGKPSFVKAAAESTQEEIAIDERRRKKLLLQVAGLVDRAFDRIEERIMKYIRSGPADGG